MQGDVEAVAFQPISKFEDAAILFDEPITVDDMKVPEPKSADAALLFSGSKMTEVEPERPASP